MSRTKGTYGILIIIVNSFGPCLGMPGVERREGRLRHGVCKCGRTLLQGFMHVQLAQWPRQLLHTNQAASVLIDDDDEGGDGGGWGFWGW